MMTTMLERAAREVAMIPMWRGSDGLNVTVSHELATHIARAVLLAVRVPCSDVVEIGMIAGQFSGMADTAFTAMIDAILEGK